MATGIAQTYSSPGFGVWTWPCRLCGDVVKYLGERDEIRIADEDAEGLIDVDCRIEDNKFVLFWFRMTRVCRVAPEESLARLVAKDRDADIESVYAEL